MDPEGPSKKNCPTARDKVEVADKWIVRGYPAKSVLEFVGLSRSTYYYQRGRGKKRRSHAGGRPEPGWSWTVAGKKMCDQEIKENLLGLIEGDGYYYGYRKLTHALRRECGLVINKKKVYRLCKELKVLRPQRAVKERLPRKVAKNRPVTGSNQLWETDLKYGYVEGEGRFFYVASIIDVFDRSIVGHYQGLRCEARDVLKTARKALEDRGLAGAGVVLRSDNGPQFSSRLMKKGCSKIGLMQEFIPFKSPNSNAHIESFHAILENECLADNRFDTFGDAHRAVEEFMRFYNTRRLHSACGYRPPEEYYRANQRKPATGLAVAG